MIIFRTASRGFLATIDMHVLIAGFQSRDTFSAWGGGGGGQPKMETQSSDRVNYLL